ncbi:electron transport complex protein RsxE [Actinobacillus equuli]|nr:electron transport complex protein RsxE [Actinobacillus equuli]
MNTENQIPVTEIDTTVPAESSIWRNLLAEGVWKITVL